MDVGQTVQLVVQGGASALLLVVLWQVSIKIDKVLDNQNALINKLIDMLDDAEIKPKP